MYRARLNGPDDFDGWRQAARTFALAGTAPADIVWQCGDADDLFATDEPPPPPEAAAFSVPRTFVELAETAILHRDPERFALLYALLIQSRDRPASLEDRADPLVRGVEGLAKAVRRDLHKMRAFVRFRELATPDAPRCAGASYRTCQCRLLRAALRIDAMVDTDARDQHPLGW